MLRGGTGDVFCPKKKPEHLVSFSFWILSYGDVTPGSVEPVATHQRTELTWGREQAERTRVLDHVTPLSGGATALKSPSLSSSVHTL